MFGSEPRPPSEPSRAMFTALFGCMNTGTSSSCALAQNGSYFGAGRRLALDVAADRRAARAEILHGMLELLGREIGELQRNRRQRHEAVGVLLAPSREHLVVQRDDIFRDCAIPRVPPEEVDAERLNVDAALVHRGEPFGTEHDRRRRDARRVRARQRCATSGNMQCACTSTTFTRLPATRTSLRFACASTRSAVRHAAAPACARNSRRLVIVGLPPPAAYGRGAHRSFATRRVRARRSTNASPLAANLRSSRCVQSQRSHAQGSDAVAIAAR